MNMKIKTEFDQSELEYVYESAKLRMKYHPDIAEKYSKIVDDFPHFNTIEEAIKSVNDKKNISSYQVWAKVEKDEEYYYIKDYYIISNDYSILVAAEYIGMEQLW